MPEEKDKVVTPPDPAPALDKVEEKAEEKVEEAPFGVLTPALPPEESPLDSDGFAGVDPDFRRGPAPL